MPVLGLYFTIPCGIIVIVSVPIYLIVLYSHHKFRHKSPFNSPFFKVSFYLGLFDILHIANDWVFAMMPYYGLRDFVLSYQRILAKQYSFVWWYSGWGQKLGVLFLAIDRFATMWFNYHLTKLQTKLLIALNFILPVFLVGPQAFFDFGFMEFNGTKGLLLYWDNFGIQRIYLKFCLFFCIVVCSGCGISYGMSFWKIRQRRIQAKASKSAIHGAKTEAKLAVAGFVLFMITIVCGVLCWCLGTQDLSFEAIVFMLGLLQLTLDIYCCVNPYLILACSTAAWIHFKAVILNKPPEAFLVTVAPMSASHGISSRRHFRRGQSTPMSAAISSRRHF